MTKKKNKTSDEVIEVDVGDTHHVEVSVDGLALPFKIGDKVNIGDGIIRTVMKI